MTKSLTTDDLERLGAEAEAIGAEITALADRVGESLTERVAPWARCLRQAMAEIPELPFKTNRDAVAAENALIETAGLHGPRRRRR